MRGRRIARSIACYAAEGGAEAYDRAPEAIEDWMIAVWLSAHEDSFHDTTVAKPLASVALVAR